MGEESKHAVSGAAPVGDPAGDRSSLKPVGLKNRLAVARARRAELLDGLARDPAVQPAEDARQTAESLDDGSAGQRSGSADTAADSDPMPENASLAERLAWARARRARVLAQRAAKEQEKEKGADRSAAALKLEKRVEAILVSKERMTRPEPDTFGIGEAAPALVAPRKMALSAARRRRMGAGSFVAGIVLVLSVGAVTQGWFGAAAELAVDRVAEFLGVRETVADRRVSPG
ncbi:MAG: hypothetical protein ACE5FS_15440, partial [Paracoccaceae bacterium]